MAVRQYIGARYVLEFAGDWDNSNDYEALTVVKYNAFTYVSKQAVPAGVAISNTDFWLLWADPNAQMAELRMIIGNQFDLDNTISDFKVQIEQDVTDTDAKLGAGFDSVNTVAKAINDEEVARILADNMRTIDFESVADMASSSELEKGMTAHTLGFHGAGKGGSAWYSIDDASSADGIETIACGDLFAKLNKEAYIDVTDYGADSTGVSDCSAIVQHIVDENNGSTVYFPSGTYLINQTILTPHEIDKFVNFVFDPSATVKTDMNLDCLFYIGGKTPASSYYAIETLGYKKYFTGGRFDASHCNYAIQVASNVLDIEIGHCTFFDCKSGIKMGGTVTPVNSMDAYIHDCNLIGTSTDSTYGIHLLAPDVKVSHCRIYGFKTCVYSVGGLYALDIHTLDLTKTPEYDINDGCAFYLASGRNSILACYGNGNATFVKLADVTAYNRIIDCEYRNWTYSDSNFCFIDLPENMAVARLHLDVIGNFIYNDAQIDAKHTIVCGINNGFLTADLNIDNNILVNAQYFPDGDLIFCQNSPVRLTIGGANYSYPGDESWIKLTTIPFVGRSNYFIVRVVAGANVFYLHMNVTWTGSSYTVPIFAAKKLYTPNAHTYTFGYVVNDEHTVDIFMKANGAFSCPSINCNLESPGYIALVNKPVYANNHSGYTPAEQPTVDASSTASDYYA